MSFGYDTSGEQNKFYFVVKCGPYAIEAEQENQQWSVAGQGSWNFSGHSSSSNNNRSSSGPAYNSPTYTKNSWEKDIYLYEFATPAKIAGTWDPVTNRRIMGLDPRIQQDATDFINLAETELDIQLRIVEGFRSTEVQNKYYAQGRTTPGKIITYSKSGHSAHNYGLAIDVVPMVNGRPNYNADWRPIGELGTNLGFEWGGNWKIFKDNPHFQQYWP